MDHATRARLLLVATIAFAILLYTVGGQLKPGYSHVSNFISELNATGTPWATWIGFAGFLPLGLLLAAFLVAAAPLVDVHGASRLGFLLLWSQPLAFIGTAFAPCDAGCPVDGSAAQAIHNLLGVSTYFAAGIGFVLLSFAPVLARPHRVGRYFLRAAGVAWVALFVLMLQPAFAPWDGLLQRVADALLAAVLVFVAWRLMPTRPLRFAAPS